MRTQRFWCQAVAGVVLAMAAGHAWACSSVEGVPVFAPNVKAETDRWILSQDRFENAPLRAIDAHVVSVRRAQPDDMCGPLTVIKVEVEWADQTNLRLEDVGIYFKVLSGTTGLGAVEYSGLNDLPRVVSIQDGKAYVILLLNDSAAPSRGPIDLDVEVFAVDKLLHLGPSSRLRIHSDV